MRTSAIPGTVRIILLSLLAAGQAVAQTPPNIVLIFVDDMGINDIGAYADPASVLPPIDNSSAGGSSRTPLPAPNEAVGLTPNIDSLATSGMKFTSFYAASPVCTPSRAGLMTGSYATRVQLEPVILHNSNVYGLHSEEVTLPERLKQRGYTTGMFGKWHLGDSIDFRPTRHGFDTFFGLATSHDLWPWHPNASFAATIPNLPVYDGEDEMAGTHTTATGGSVSSPLNKVSKADSYTNSSYLLEAMTEKAIAFMQAAHAAGQPFFVYFSSHAPHVPCIPHPDYAGASGVSTYYDVMMELDARVGQILTELDTLGITNDTIVLFTSDNGPFVTRPEPTWLEQAVGSAYPYRGYKRIAYEGGPRVPLLVRYPGQVAAGVVEDGLSSNIDLMPTLLSLAGAEIPADRTLDGVDLWPLMNGSTGTSPRTEFFYYEENDTAAVGVRQGDWKYLFSSLYNLFSDIQEQTNVAGFNASTASALSSLISSHNSSMVRRARGLPQSNQIEIRRSAADPDNTNTVRITEGGTATFEVRLASSANATVTISRFSGDAGISVQSGASLTFTTGNYNVWQTVTLAAAVDADSTDDGATFRAASGSMHVREIFALETDTGSGDPPPSPEPDLPATISGLVGWYDAQLMFYADGTPVTSWSDRVEGANTVAHNLTQYTGAAGTAVAPKVHTVSLNGYNYRSIRFLAGATGEYEQLKVDNLVSSANNTRTIIAAYKGGIDNANSRPVGFGSRLVDSGLNKELWNLATDGTYGSARFDGAFIGPYTAAGLTRDEFLLRTAVMESRTSFDEFIDELDVNFVDTQRLSNGSPSAALATVLGSFHVGDVHNNAIGGGNGAADFDILEILVYDRVLTTQERQDVQNYLKMKYTTEPYPLGQPALSFVSVGDDTYLAITYKRIAGGSGTTGVNYTALGRTYTVEYDTDLTAPWSSGSVTPVGLPVDNGDGTETVTVRLDIPFSAPGMQFLRLRVSTP